MEAVYRRSIPKRYIDSPTFCHGVAGLLQVTLRFAHDTNLPIFNEAASALTEQLLSLYAPERTLGFCCTEPGGNLVDQPGLLDGAPGVALVLLAASAHVESAWTGSSCSLDEQVFKARYQGILRPSRLGGRAGTAPAGGNVHSPDG